MLSYYLPFSMKDLTPLFEWEPYYSPHSERIRYFADDKFYIWHSRTTQTRIFIHDMLLKAHLKELEKIQIQNA